MKRVSVYALLMFIFCTFCKGQNNTQLPKDTIKSETKYVISYYRTSTMVRSITQDRNGNIWIASTEGII